MDLSRRSIETLIDLVEIKLGCMEVYDRDDARELNVLEACRKELSTLRSQLFGRRSAKRPQAEPLPST